MINLFKKSKIKYFRPHRGEYSDVILEYKTEDDLFSLEEINNFTKHTNFTHFSISDYSKYNKDWPYYLIANYDDLKCKYWVVGFLKEIPTKLKIEE